MKALQISKRDIKLLLFLGCVLVLAGSYFFGYKHYGEKREAEEAQIKILQEKYDDLNSKNVNREKYIKETEENEKKIEELKGSYPSTVAVENEIYFTKLLQEHTKAVVTQMTYTEPESFYVDNEAGVTTGIKGYKAVSTISFESDYTSLKKAIQYIQSAKYRRVIESINISVDRTTGKLSGSMAYNDYYLEGAGCKYEPDTIPAGASGAGVSNIFGNLVKSK
ncbi:MAG: hypothetical protein Q4F05_05245 [bacterium]|nr:hypothetical protein [bacterium]